MQENSSGAHGTGRQHIMAIWKRTFSGFQDWYKKRQGKNQ